MDLLIKNGMLVTVDEKRAVCKGDIAVKDGKIVQIGNCGGVQAAKVIDAEGCVVMPGSSTATPTSTRR